MFYTIEWLDTKWGLNRIHHTYTTKELLKLICQVKKLLISCKYP